MYFIITFYLFLLVFIRLSFSLPYCYFISIVDVFFYPLLISLISPCFHASFSLCSFLYSSLFIFLLNLFFTYHCDFFIPFNFCISLFQYYPHVLSHIILFAWSVFPFLSYSHPWWYIFTYFAGWLFLESYRWFWLDPFFFPHQEIGPPVHID